LGDKKERAVKMRRGIGGSEWDDILGLSSFGCRRRLFYKKTEAPPDFAPEESGYMEAGKRFQGLALRELCDRVGAKIVSEDVELGPAPGLPGWMHGYADGIVTVGKVKIPVEIKVREMQSFRKVTREGSSESVVAQVVHYHALAKAHNLINGDYGLIGTLCPIPFAIHRETIPADPELLKGLIREGETFWNECLAGRVPDRKEEGSSPCSRCQWRLTCWEGLPPASKKERETDLIEIRDEAIEAAIRRLLELSLQKDSIDEEEKIVRGYLKDKLQEGRFSIAGHRVYNMRPDEANQEVIVRELREKNPRLLLALAKTVDLVRARKEVPEVVELATRPASSTRLRIF